MKLGNYEVEWEYIWFDSTLNYNAYPIAIICKLTHLNPDIVDIKYVMGEANCHPKDQFNKEFGRKLALTRALDSLGLDKQERTQIWQDYFNRKKK